MTICLSNIKTSCSFIRLYLVLPSIQSSQTFLGVCWKEDEMSKRGSFCKLGLMAPGSVSTGTMGTDGEARAAVLLPPWPGLLPEGEAGANVEWSWAVLDWDQGAGRKDEGRRGNNSHSRRDSGVRSTAVFTPHLGIPYPRDHLSKWSQLLLKWTKTPCPKECNIYPLYR